MVVYGMSFVETHAASAIKLNTNKVTLTVGKTTKIRVKNYKKKVTWSSAKKLVATVTSVGKYVGKIKAKKEGSTKIYAKCGNRKLVCKVTVKKQNTSKEEDEEVQVAQTPEPTIAPTAKVTINPTIIVKDNQKYLVDQSLEYDEEDQTYHLYFSITLSDNQTRKEYAGNVDLIIYNSQQELVYNQSKAFTTDDFFVEDPDGEEKADDNGERKEEAESLCDVEISASEILPGSSSEGVLYYSISLEDDTWFSKRALDIEHLPIKVTEKPEETVVPLATKTPQVQPTATAKTKTPCPTMEPNTEEPEKTEFPTVEPTITVKPTKTPLPTEAVRTTATPKPTVTPKILTPIPTATLVSTAKPTASVKPTKTPTITPKITPKITPTPEVTQTRDEVLKENINTLRTYLIVNGNVDENGEFYLEWSNENDSWKYTISCSLLTEEIVYSLSREFGEYDAVFVMESNPVKNDCSILKCSCTSKVSQKSGKAILSFENLSYTQFQAKDFYIMGNIAENDIQNMANIMWYSGMAEWDNQLDYMNLSLKMVGYDNYGSELADNQYSIRMTENVLLMFKDSSVHYTATQS